MGAGAPARTIDRRVWRLALAGLAAALIFAGTPLNSRAAAPGAPDAVVLVSGITTTTPFTSPGAVCTGKYPRGTTWTYHGARFAAAGYRVYTAPVNFGAGPVKSDPPQFSGCPSQLPASMTINSRGDIYADARALASFIGYLHSHFGVNTVRFVAHSYGGLWTRGAMRLASADFPAVQVQSITTLGTPHLGSFMADIGEAVDPSLCGTDLGCRAIAYLMIAFRDSYFEPAMSQVTAAAVAQWNPGQGASLKGIPLTAIGGDAVSIKGLTSPYISPNDLLVGIQSAQAVGLQANGVIPELSCFPAFPDVHSNTFLPFVPSVKHSLLNDPQIATDVEQTLAGQPPATACPNPAFPPTLTGGPPFIRGVARNQVTVPLRTAGRPSGAQTARSASESAVIIRSGTSVTCDGRKLASMPFMGSTRLRVIPQPRCNGPLRTSQQDKMLFLADAPGSATFRVQGRRIHISIRGSLSHRKLAVAIRRGRRFVAERLDHQHSLRVSGAVQTVTLRVVLAASKGRSAVAVATIHL